MKNYILAVPLETISSSTMTGAYIPINAGGLPAACNIMYIINSSSVPVTISYDGSEDNDYLPANSTRELNLQTNAGPNNWACYLKKGTIVYAKSAAGTGVVALVAYYQEV